MSHTYDIVILNLPWSDLKIPYLAPAILKGIAESHGYTAKTIDFNIDLFNKFCNKQEDVYTQANEYYMTYTQDKPAIINKFYDHIIAELKKLKFRYLGISVFYILSQKATFELCTRLRDEMPDTKIVLGGKGLNVYSHISVHTYLEESQKTIPFDKMMANKDLADYFIRGDAEDAIIDLLSGRIDSDPTMLGNWFTPKKDNLDYPFADFDDYQLDQYVGPGKDQKIQLPVISSKGCVRRCDFCDVPSQFKKFQSKDGKRMAEEMLFLADKYKIYRFTLADSIANGNLKALVEFAKIMAEYNNGASEEKKIKWSANWIHRPVGQVTEEKFKLIAESGAEHFSVGAEHFSNHVLKHMNKKATMEGFMHELNLFRKYHVQCIVNNIIGHWSERYVDFKEHINSLIRLGPFFSQDIITMMYMSLFYIMRNTPAAQQPDKTGLTMLEDDFSLAWHSSKNPNLTLKTRLARHYYVIMLCNYLNYPIELNAMLMKNYQYRVEQIMDKSMRLFKDKINFDEFQPCEIFGELDDVESYADKKIQEYFPTSELKVKFVANSCKGDPVLFVKVNDQVLIDESFAQGEHEITLPFAYDYSGRKNKIEIGMKNKQKYDTIIDTTGKILQDKNIQLVSVLIDCIDMLDYPDYFNETCLFIANGEKSDPASGFWHNGEIILQFQAPFWRSLQKHKQKWTTRKDKYQFQESLNQFRKFFSQLEY